jgi:DNA-directed RNA polymerase subunit beta'
MRTFHIGGTASRRAEQTTLESRNEGFIKFINVSTVTNKDGDQVVMNRNGEVAIVDYPEGEKGRMRERERYPVVYGAKLKKRARVNTTLAVDPYTIRFSPGSPRGQIRRRRRGDHHGRKGR